MFFRLHRQNGLGYCCFIARVGVSLSPLILLLEEVWGQLPSIVFFLVAIAGGLAASSLPETRTIRLPETIEDVEGTRYRPFIRIKSDHGNYYFIYLFYFIYIFLQIKLSFCVSEEVPSPHLMKNHVIFVTKKTAHNN